MMLNMQRVQANIAGLRTPKHSCTYQQCGISKRVLTPARRRTHQVPASVSATATTSIAYTDLPAATNLSAVNTEALLKNIDVSKVTESLEVVERYSAQAAGVANTALQQLLSPFQVFGESWYLNVMFFGVVGLLTYSLLILAPRQ